MENSSRNRLLDAALDLLGRCGPTGMTLRAVEDAALVPHGSVRHHFGGRAGMIGALFQRLAERERASVEGLSIAAALAHWLGPGRILTLARYELFMMAARDPALRVPLVEARDQFVAVAAERVGATAAPALVAALDGLVLDALVRGDDDSDRLDAAVRQIAGRRPWSTPGRPPTP
jgi:AcrR family transcriptional regulator